MDALGLDGCPAGWAGAWREDGQMRFAIFPTFGEAMNVGNWAAVAVDIPIGLLPDRIRSADRLARERLRPYRSSSVFSTPIRPALEAATYAEGLALQRAIVGSGFSKQAWMLKPKILEVDTWLRANPGHCVRETHPELVFASLTGGPCEHSKKTVDGRGARVQALKFDDFPKLRGAHENDLVDAALCLQTALFQLQNQVVSLPDPPELDPFGQFAGIVIPRPCACII